MTLRPPDPRNHAPAATGASGLPAHKEPSTVMQNQPQPREPLYVQSIAAADEIMAMVKGGGSVQQLQQLVHATRLQANTVGVVDGINIGMERAAKRTLRLLRPGRN